MLAVGRQILGNIDDQTIRMTTGFAGGVGGTHHDLCGAFSSGVMILGALYGRVDSSKDDTRCREIVKEFRHRFESQLGAVYCHELRVEDYGSQGKEPCSVLVERASRILLSFIAEVKNS
jgi:C_GCAxxG_C_C family probable redox protein